MQDGIAMAEILIGLPGMRVLEVRDGEDESVVRIETTADRAWCPECGVRAQAQDRTTKAVRDLSCFRAAGTLGSRAAAVALPGGVVRSEDVDRTNTSRRLTRPPC